MGLVPIIHQYIGPITLILMGIGIPIAVYQGRKEHQPAEDLSWVRKQWRYTK